jgi:MOSC domain-containing protein YiiM
VTLRLDLVSVNVALPTVIGQHRGRPLKSGIGKVPVSVPSLRLVPHNLEGDGQADLTVHGGPDKAVYAYPAEHLAPWSEELAQTLGPGAFGENLSTTGALETDVAIGDRFQWGDAIIEVSQPRWPCFKLTIYRGVADMAARLRRSGRTGWYFRIVEPGPVPVAGPLVLVSSDPGGVTVHEAHRAALPGADPALVTRVLAAPALAAEWRAQVGG